MHRSILNLVVISTIVLMLVPNAVNAQQPISGPWLWMIAPTEPGKGGAASTNIDSLAVASGGDVTESEVALKGANAGDTVSNYRWTLGTLNPSGNINQLLVDTGMTYHYLNDYSSYALIVLEAATDQHNITMGTSSDDSIKVWLNGQVVYTNPIDRGRSSPPNYQDTFQISLLKGNNLLMVKVGQGVGGWGMHVGINGIFNTNIPSQSISYVAGDIPQSDPQHIYWVDISSNIVQRSNLDGSDVATIAGGDGRPVGIVVDADGGKVYWSDRTSSNPSDSSGSSRIYRMNLDSTEKEMIIQGGPSVMEYLALDYFSGKIYWSEWSELDSNHKIRRANLDGSKVEDIITGLTHPRGIALDNVGRKIYWSQQAQSNRRIQNANLDGSDIQDVLVTDGAHGLALDMADRKIYWTGWSTGNVQRANLDGTNVVQLVSGLREPAGIALDLQNNKMYWAEARAGRIQRANLDGSNVEPVVTGLASIIGLTLSIPPTDVGDLPVYVDYTVSLSPAQIESPASGQQLTFSLNITDSTKIAGFQAAIQFDETALNFVSSTAGDFLLADTYMVEPVLADNMVTIAASSLTGENSGNGTLATITFEVVNQKASSLILIEVLLTESDGQVKIPYTENATITSIQYLREDVNRDGSVNILDLVFVAGRIGVTERTTADVNRDGSVNVLDLVLVAGAFGKTAAAASLLSLDAGTIPTRAEVESWLKEAQQLNLTDPKSLRGINYMKQLLLALAPQETALLANYPNPFNPETWIPYQLAQPANVTLQIYGVDGNLIRTLSLGHQDQGIYFDRKRAAYWDGKNAVRESVASGIYYYTLIAGEFTATRKMLILK